MFTKTTHDTKRSHKDAQGLTRAHKGSQGHTRTHKDSQGLTRTHKDTHAHTQTPTRMNIWIKTARINGFRRSNIIMITIKTTKATVFKRRTNISQY